MKLLLTDSVTLKSNNDLSLDVFKRFGEVEEYDNIDRQTLLKKVGGVDAILCNKTVIDREVIDRAPNLKYIGLFATGYNNIDLSCAKEKGIVVCNAGSYSTDAVTQQVFAFILSHFCRISEYDDFVKGGGWKCSPVFSPLVFSTDEIAGKTLGIVGYGSIGRSVERVARAFNMKVLVNTRTIRENGQTEFCDLDTLLKESDIVTLHCPLNSENSRFMNAERFAKMKEGAFFINTARGGLVDEQALFEALESGRLSGAGIDVLTSEPMEESCILHTAKNIIITPHTAWAPLATRKRLVDIVVSNIEAFLNGKPINTV